MTDLRKNPGGQHRGSYGPAPATSHEKRGGTSWESRPARNYDYVNGGKCWCYQCNSAHPWGIDCPPVVRLGQKK